jgi:hypothetical protein
MKSPKPFGPSPTGSVQGRRLWARPRSEHERRKQQHEKASAQPRPTTHPTSKVSSAQKSGHASSRVVA